MKILITASNPRNTTRLDLDEEVRLIEKEIASSKLRDKISLRSALAARPADFIRSLNEHSPDILHFCGHGDETGKLVFTEDSRMAKGISLDIIADLFSTLDTPPKIIIMNSCFSILQATELTKHSDIVIGMPNSVTDEDAASFSGFFYSALCMGKNVNVAFRQGIIGTALAGGSCWGSGEPVILIRDGISASNIVLSDGDDRVKIVHKSGRQVFKNRDGGRSFIKKRFSKFVESSSLYSIVFIDIKGMNSINSRYGWKIGDTVISETLLVIDSANPDADAIGLCGDDTFFMIYTGVSRKETISIGTQTMTAIETNDWGRIHDDLFVRVAAGYAVRRDDEAAIDVLSRAGTGLRSAQDTDLKFYETPELAHRRLRGKAPDVVYKLTEKEMEEWFS